MLREETERIVTSHIRERESRAKEQVTATFTRISAACEQTAHASASSFSSYKAEKNNTENTIDLKSMKAFRRF